MTGDDLPAPGRYKMLINDALKDLTRKRKAFLSWQKEEKIALDIQQKFTGNGLEIYVNLDSIMATDGIYIEISGVRNMEDLAPIFKLLAEKGIERKSVKPIILGDWSLVIWNFNNMQLKATFNSKDENACKFKQVGTKEVPVYEIDCRGLEKGDAI